MRVIRIAADLAAKRAVQLRRAVEKHAKEEVRERVRRHQGHGEADQKDTNALQVAVADLEDAVMEEEEDGAHRNNGDEEDGDGRSHHQQFYTGTIHERVIDEAGTRDSVAATESDVSVQEKGQDRHRSSPPPPPPPSLVSERKTMTTTLKKKAAAETEKPKTASAKAKPGRGGRGGTDERLSNRAPNLDTATIPKHLADTVVPLKTSEKRQRKKQREEERTKRARDASRPWE